MSVIGKTLGKSRNAVISKVKRLGLPQKTNIALGKSTSRTGQPQFRQNVLATYNYTCAITGTESAEVLEAAHIVPYSKAKDHGVGNGLCLRADIHSLFDLGLISISPALIVEVSSRITDPEYTQYNRKLLILPSKARSHLNYEALSCHQRNIYMP